MGVLNNTSTFILCNKLPGEEILQESPASPLPWPFDPYNLLHFQTIQMNHLGCHWPTSQPKTAVMPPSPVREHLQPVEMTAASCRLRLLVVQSKAPIDSQEAVQFGERKSKCS